MHNAPRDYRQVLAGNLKRCLDQAGKKRDTLKAVYLDGPKRGETVSPRTITNMLDPDAHSPSLDAVAAVANALGELMPWQLLVPGMDPTNPPTIRMTAEERKLHERIPAPTPEAATIGGMMRACITVALVAGCLAGQADAREPGEWTIKPSGAFACQSRADVDRLVRYRVQRDDGAFYKAWADLERSGACIVIRGGTDVYLTDTESFGTMARVRQRGLTREYWTPASYLQK